VEKLENSCQEAGRTNRNRKLALLQEIVGYAENLILAKNSLLIILGEGISIEINWDGD